MINRSVTPAPWWQVGLTVLPGAMLLLLPSSLPASAVPAVRVILLTILVLLALAGAAQAVRRHSVFLLPAWCLIPLGLLAGFLAFAGLITLTGTADRYPAAYVLLAVVGLAFARYNGPFASLFVLVGGILTASAAVEPGMYLDLGASAWARFLVNEAVFVLFLFGLPIVLLRARSYRVQLAGLLAAMTAYATAFAYTLSAASGLAQPMFAFSLGQAVSVLRPYVVLFVTVALAALIYALVQARAGAAADAAAATAA